MIKVLSKERFLRCDEKGRPVVPGFVTYVSRNKQILLHRSGERITQMLTMIIWTCSAMIMAEHGRSGFYT